MHHILEFSCLKFRVALVPSHIRGRSRLTYPAPACVSGELVHLLQLGEQRRRGVHHVGSCGLGCGVVQLW
jgi:hypothetical protein